MCIHNRTALHAQTAAMSRTMTWPLLSTTVDIMCASIEQSGLCTDTGMGCDGNQMAVVGGEHLRGTRTIRCSKPVRGGGDVVLIIREGQGPVMGAYMPEGTDLDSVVEHVRELCLRTSFVAHTFVGLENHPIVIAWAVETDTFPGPFMPQVNAATSSDPAAVVNLQLVLGAGNRHTVWRQGPATRIKRCSWMERASLRPSGICMHLDGYAAAKVMTASDGWRAPDGKKKYKRFVPYLTYGGGIKKRVPPCWSQHLGPIPEQ